MISRLKLEPYLLLCGCLCKYERALKKSVLARARVNYITALLATRWLNRCWRQFNRGAVLPLYGTGAPQNPGESRHLDKTIKTLGASDVWCAYSVMWYTWDQQEVMIGQALVWLSSIVQECQHQRSCR
jgi:hypothetical protein